MHREPLEVASLLGGAPLIYRPNEGWVLMWLAMLAIFFGGAGVMMEMASRGDGPPLWLAGIFAVFLLALAGFITYVWLWCECLWLRVDAATLEWSTLLIHGQVPLHEVLEIARDSRWSASIDIREHRSLFVQVGPGFEDLTASIVAGAPHVRVVDNRD